MMIKMTFRNIVRLIVLVPIGIFLLYSLAYFGNNKLRPEYLDCGKVVSKSNDEVAIKYGVKTELYLNIQFEKSGFRSIECNPTTYFSKKVNERVCFYLDEKTTALHKILFISGGITLAIVGIIVLVFLIMYLLPENFGD